MRHSPGHTLFIDADDTLWENNVHFDAVVAEYCDLLSARGVPPADAAGRLLDIERRRTKTHGYGIANFQASLEEACGLQLGEDCERERRLLAAACRRLARVPVDVLDGVVETLRELAGRHRIILMTKGERDDQLSKLTRSTLADCFHQVDVVREKDRETYLDACHRFGVREATGWMVGNSPRSDITPALEAGLRAVFVPHAHTWVLERAELEDWPTDRLLVISRFAELVEHF
jgi:putative hydrolase of the HAD superfamily